MLTTIEWDLVQKQLFVRSTIDAQLLITGFICGPLKLIFPLARHSTFLRLQHLKRLLAPSRALFRSSWRVHCWGYPGAKMDEAWIAYLCLILFVLTVILMKQKPDDEVKKEKETESRSTPTTYYGGGPGRAQEFNEEEIAASMERLTSVLFSADGRKREPHHEHRSSSSGKEVGHFNHSKIQAPFRSWKVFATQHNPGCLSGLALPK